MTEYNAEYNTGWGGRAGRPRRGENVRGMGHGHASWGHREDWLGGRGGPFPRAAVWGRRMRRGDIRGVLLTALLEGPAHGYELITRLEQRTGGMWRPSAGSVYPTLQLLEEEGKVTGRDEGGKRVYELTDEGRSEAEQASQRAPWGDEALSGPQPALHQAFRQLAMAMRQVSVAGDPAQVEAATAIISEARQKLYHLLAGE